VAALSGGVAQVSLLLYLEPVVSVAGAALFLGERVTLVMIGGGALILTGVALSGTAERRRERRGWRRRQRRRPTRESRSARSGC
jgi:drug/metabolite transporter (DMT)-like permease